MTSEKILYRSRGHRMIAGVCGGLADYFGLDPTVVRLAWVAVSVLGMLFPGVLLYIIAIVLVPEEPVQKK